MEMPGLTVPIVGYLALREEKCFRPVGEGNLPKTTGVLGEAADESNGKDGRGGSE